MIQRPACIHPDDALAGAWQERVAELLDEAAALIPTECHPKATTDLRGVAEFWMFLPAPELQGAIRKRNRAAKNKTLALDLLTTK